jgi:hypothetical protein
MAQLTWNELIAAVSNRLRESEDPDADQPIGEVDVPYYTKTQIENSLLEISNQKLLEVSPEELQDSTAVVTTANMSSGTAFTSRYLRILSVTIRPQVSDTVYVASQPMTPAAFIQQQNADVNIVAGWSVFDNKLYFIGGRATMVGIPEVSLANWRALSNLLPDGYDEERIDWVTKQLQIMNFMPKGSV